MRIQNEHIKVALTNDENTLGWLREKKLLHVMQGKLGAEGWEVYTLQYDSMPIDFKRNRNTGERTVHPIGFDVAKALRRSSVVIDPRDFNGETAYALDEVEKFNLVEGDPNATAAEENLCPYCGIAQKSPGKLAHHITHECQRAKAVSQKTDPALFTSRRAQYVPPPPKAVKAPVVATQKPASTVAMTAPAPSAPPAPPVVLNDDDLPLDGVDGTAELETADAVGERA